MSELKLLNVAILDECLNMVAEDGALPSTANAIRGHIAALEAALERIERGTRVGESHRDDWVNAVAKAALPKHES
jgi:hypothetical protein